MKKLLAGAAALVVTALVWGQNGSRTYTTPTPPLRDVLDRLNLKVAWSARLRTDGRRDGFFTLQILPGRDPAKDTPQLLAQTFHGSVVLLDCETGDVLWRTEVGQPYWPGQAAAFNKSSVLTSRREFLYVLNRASGQQRAYVLDKQTKLPTFGLPMQSVPSAGLAADRRTVFVPMGHRLTAYELPDYAGVDKAKPEDLSDFETRQRLQNYLMPDFLWSALSPEHDFQRAPLMTLNRVGVVSTAGTFLSYSKDKQLLLFDYKFNGGVSAAMAQHEDIAYIPCGDSTLYALNMVNARLMWRFLSGSPIQRKPEATDRDVYVSPERLGLVCLDRQTGREKWTNKTAQRFLSTNFKYVYAADRLGNLLILDYARGTQLGKLDTTGYVVPVSNDLSDRLYFASHDGQILCLHCKENRKPLVTKTLPKEYEEKRDFIIKDDKKDPDKKDPDKKDPDKKDPDPDKKDPDKKDADKEKDKAEHRRGESADDVGIALNAKPSQRLAARLDPSADAVLMRPRFPRARSRG